MTEQINVKRIEKELRKLKTFNKTLKYLNKEDVDLLLILLSGILGLLPGLVRIYGLNKAITTVFDKVFIFALFDKLGLSYDKFKA